MSEAREWARENPSAWDYFKQQALLASQRGYASAKEVAWQVRMTFKVGINDKLVSSLARIAKEENPAIRFKFKKSKVDGYTDAKLGG